MRKKSEEQKKFVHNFFRHEGKGNLSSLSIRLGAGYTRRGSHAQDKEDNNKKSN